MITRTLSEETELYHRILKIAEEYEREMFIEAMFEIMDTILEENRFSFYRNQFPPNCPDCGIEMELRFGDNHTFWGCPNSRFTGCKQRAYTE
ncbi:hypothetical protein Mpt1_c09920 [Candidatus Methanoplasma termitum]|uniref:DNA topoisomerase I n=1 Tax=Candidatus Methanoplasma termitum TaxID=1577791 RepID=A0A0A7LH66_9ARCH|nr:hypothetical protein [Candidatus Methanoplasma termitum]AIZ56866.1 hypothetical protein Mpt1_c09920 [Candidatus Methanoplasma termitum]